MANEPIRKDAGIVSAYGAAVRGGYTGTYDEFCQQQATYAETAAAVQQAKVDAEAAAGRAESAATATAQDKTDADAAARAASQSKTDAETAATNAGQSKTAAEDAAGRAEAAIESYDEMTAEAETLTPGSDATAEIDRTGDHPVLKLGIPEGQQGDPGTSPTVAVTEITGGHRVVITDAEGDHPFDVMDGEDGAVLSVNGKTGNVVLDGNDINIDNSNQTPESIADGFGRVNRALTDKYEKPTGGIPASDLADGVIPEVPVQDVQINGSSILSQGVANVPVADANNFGTVKVSTGSQGITKTSGGTLSTVQAQTDEIKAGANGNKVIVPANQDTSAFYGLAKAAGDSTQSASSNAVGTYTDAAKVAIQKMLGIYEAPWELIREDTFTNSTLGPYEISVDGNGSPFELTDALFILTTPVQETQVELGTYGRVFFYYGDSSMTYETAYLSAYTQAPGSNAKTSSALITQTNGLRAIQYLVNSSTGADISPKIHSNVVPSSAVDGWAITKRTYNKVIIENILGTAKIALYGKRKWN